nr:DUF2568 domain-containing protein [Metabacillus kandeliae]
MLAFLLELFLLAVFFYWGLTLNVEILFKIIAAVLAPAAAAFLWGRYAAPRSPRRLRGYHLILFKTSLFLLAACVLYFKAGETAAAAFMVIFAVNTMILAKAEKGGA